MEDAGQWVSQAPTHQTPTFKYSSRTGKQVKLFLKKKKKKPKLNWTNNPDQGSPRPGAALETPEQLQGRVAWPRAAAPDQQGHGENGNSYCIVVRLEQSTGLRQLGLGTAGRPHPFPASLGCTERDQGSFNPFLKAGTPEPLPLGAEGR